MIFVIILQVFVVAGQISTVSFVKNHAMYAIKCIKLYDFRYTVIPWFQDRLRYQNLWMLKFFI